MSLVTFDAAKLKHPNTGLYHFTLQLSRALSLEGFGMDFFSTHPDVLSSVGVDMVRRIGLLDKFLRRNPCGSVVWHTPYQFSSYSPPRGVRQVLTVHDLNFLYEKCDSKQSRYLQKLQFEIDRCDYVVAISDFSLGELCRFVDLGATPRRVIYNGCNIPIDSAQTPVYRPRRRFLYGIGAILAKKNWAVLSALLVGRDDLELVISGTGGGDYSEEILSRAASLGVSDRVTLTGGVSEGEKRWYLEHCDTFVFPSLAEGFGLPVIEAMYYGKPLLLSPHTSLPEVGGPHAHYLPADFDPAGMRAAFSELERDPYRGSSAEAQSARALSFSWERAAKEYISIYRDLLSSPRV